MFDGCQYALMTIELIIEFEEDDSNAELPGLP
jgi:hypothetical protein